VSVKAVGVSVLLAIVVATCYLNLQWSLDRTTAATTNGLWKAGAVSRAAAGGGAAPDSGGYLYAPVTGWLCNRVPESWVDFGAPVADVTFRKMAVVNCCLGGICAGLVFLLAWSATRLFYWSFAMAVFHASCAFVMVCSLNNEDIMPGYTCFLAAAVLLFATRDFRAAGVLGAGVFSALATLLHWTLTPPLAAAACVTFLMAVRRDITRMGVFAAAAILYGVALFKLPLENGMNLAPWQVLVPMKATTSGWVGFRLVKWKFLTAAIPQYFVGGMNISDEFYLFKGPQEYLVIPAVLLTLGSLAACVRCALRGENELRLRALGAFGVVLFVVAQLQNIYAQPQDPQMQIQPMLVVIIAGIVLGAEHVVRLRTAGWLAGAGAVVLCGAMVLANTELIRRNNPTDSESIRFVQELRRQFPPQQTTLVLGGMEAWSSWDCLITFQGDVDECNKKDRTIFRSLVTSETADELVAALAKAECAGERVFANALWSQSRSEFSDSTATIAGVERSEVLYDLFRRGTASGKTVRVGNTDFVEILQDEKCGGPER